jgi:hypothetical protein
MSTSIRSSSRIGAVAAGVVVLSLAGAGVGRADSTPVGPLPKGPVSKTTTKPGQLVAVALPRAKQGSGLVWRVARAYDSRIVRQVSEGDLGPNVVLVYRVVGRGDTTLVFAQTRGESSSRALKSATYRVHST